MPIINNMSSEELIKLVKHSDNSTKVEKALASKLENAIDNIHKLEDKLETINSLSDTSDE